MTSKTESVFTPVEGEELKDVEKFPLFRYGVFKMSPENVYQPLGYVKEAENIKKFMPRPSDVFVIGAPKSGTTWAQEIVWAMSNNKNFDNPLQQYDIYVKSPYFEGVYYEPKYNLVESFGFSDVFTSAFPNLKLGDNYSYWSLLDLVPEVRVVKSHLYPSMHNPELMEKCKIVLIIRDPIDTLVSFFHFAKSFLPFDFDGNIEEFADLYMKERVPYGCTEKAWWPYRNHKNIHLVYYEDLKLDTMKELKRLNEFLDTQLSEEKLLEIKEFTSIMKMKERNEILEGKSDKSRTIYTDKVKEYGGLLRKGVVGDSKNKMSAELHETLQKHFREKYDGIDLPYEYLKK